jgi:hypothetical protein
MSGWDVETWKAAWGDNLAMICRDDEIAMPTPPEGLSWLVVREVTGTHPTYCVFLMEIGAVDTQILHRGRIDKTLYGERGVQGLAADMLDRVKRATS